MLNFVLSNIYIYNVLSFDLHVYAYIVFIFLTKNTLYRYIDNYTKGYANVVSLFGMFFPLSEGKKFSTGERANRIDFPKPDVVSR